MANLNGLIDLCLNVNNTLMKSNVKIYGDFVVKHVVMYPEITFLREITWLKKMTDFERVPNLIDYNDCTRKPFVLSLIHGMPIFSSVVASWCA